MPFRAREYARLAKPLACFPLLDAEAMDHAGKNLPRFMQSLKRKAVAAAGDREADMETSLDAALIQMADDFISSAVAFGSGLARRRKSSKLDAADVSVYLEQTW